MAKYLILFNSSATLREVMAQSSPEQVQASMTEWIEWRDMANKTCKFEFGMPLESAARITTQDVTASDTNVTGYATIEGDSKEVVTELLQSHPHLKRPGCSIDLLEMMPLDK